MAYLLKQIDLNQLCHGLSESKETIPRNNNNTSLEVLKSEFHPIITKFKYNDDIMCDVCLDRSYIESNLIVICDLCEAAVHQNCYGSELLKEVPGGDWFCKRCQVLQANNLDYRSIRCSFCPQLKGIMKIFNGSFWAHIACMKWIPDFDKIDEEIQNVLCESYNLERNLVCCTFCNVMYGACIQCDYDSCLVSFHVTCAQRKGIIPNNEAILEFKRSNRNFEMKIFCKQHESNQSRIITDSYQEIKNIFSDNIHDFSCICKGFNDPLIKFMAHSSNTLKRKFAVFDDSLHSAEKTFKKVKINDEVQKDSKNKSSTQKLPMPSSEEKTQQTRIDSYLKKVSVEKKDVSPPATTSNLKQSSFSAHANFEEEKNNNPLNSFDDQKSKILMQKEREEIYQSKKEPDIFTKENRNSNISKLFLTNPFSEEKKIEKLQENDKIIAKKMVFNIEKKKLDRHKAKKIEKNDILPFKPIFPTETEKQSHEGKKREVSLEKIKKSSEPLETLKTNADSKKEKEPIKEKTNESSSENTLIKEMKIKKLGKADETNKELTQINQEKATNLKLINEKSFPKELKNIEKEKINSKSEYNAVSVKKKIKKLRDYDNNNHKSSIDDSDNDQHRKKLKKTDTEPPVDCLGSTADKIKVIINNEDLHKDKEIKRKYKLEEEEKEKNKDKVLDKEKHREKDKEKEKIEEKNIKKKLYGPDSFNLILEEKNLLDPKKREKSISESKTSKEKSLSHENIHQASSLNEGTDTKNPNTKSDLNSFKENKIENRKEEMNEKKVNEKKDEKNVERSKFNNLEVKNDKKKNDAILEGDLMIKKMKIDQQKKKSGLTRLISGMDEVNTLVLKKFKLDWIHYVDKKYNEPDINKVFENLSIN